MAAIEIDTDHRLAAVTRRVEDSDREGPYKAVVASERYASPVDDVWDAVTDADRLARWFLPVTGELRLGGTYQLEGNAGGEVLECDPGARFLVTWVYDDNVSWVEVTLTADGDGTRMRLVHTCHADNPFWDQYGPGAVGVGWESGMIGLALHLATGETVDPEAFQTWSTDAEGRRFGIASAANWGAAEVAGGEDPDVARRRADEVASFYTTPPPEEPAG
ncbi:MAG TPA: SRPBCC family protein [Iamia sp.]|jgi:uncharacterized protein YndB with AHSA1/START domain|nr:SRPBCC family protein [Iamia sp.]